MLDLFQVLRNQAKPTVADQRASQQVPDQHGKPESLENGSEDESRSQDDEQIIDESDDG